MIESIRRLRAASIHQGRRHGDVVGCGLVFVAAFAAYFRTLAPTIATVFDDSLELQLVSYELGIAHPTGYPLYTLLGKLFTFIPIGDVAFRVNLMSGVFGGLTAPLVFLACRQLDCRRLPAIAAALVFAFCPVVWSQAVVAEVYSLNALFVAALIYLLFMATRGTTLESGTETEVAGRRSVALAAMAFTFGLALTHHRTIVLMAPAAILYLWLERSKLPPVSPKNLLSGALLVAAPLLLYLYIPLRGTTTSSLDGTYVNTPAGFLAWVTAASYGAFLGENPLARETATPLFTAELMVQQFGYGGIMAGVAGLLFVLVNSWQRFVLLGGTLVTFIAFGIVYRASDVEVFYIPAFMVVAIGIGYGLTAIWRWMDRDARFMQSRHAALSREALARRRAATTAWSAFRWLVAGSCLAIAVLLPVDLLVRTMPLQELNQNRTASEYGREILRQPLEEGAAVVGIQGEVTLLRYFQSTEGIRTDLRLVAADREEERLAAISRLMAAGSPVYLTRPLDGAERSHSLSSFGPLIRVRRAPLTESPAIAVPRTIDFSGQAMLLGFSLNETPGVEPGTNGPGLLDLLRKGSSRGATAGPADLPHGVEAGKRLGITLFWRSVVSLTEDYKVSLRVVDATGRLVAQQDGKPVSDAYPTSAWRPGEVVVDTHYLHVPIGTAPGEYQIKLALYSAGQPGGVKAFDGARLESVVALGSVQVARPAEPPVLDGLPPKTIQQIGRPSLPGWTERESLASLGISSVVRGNFDNQITLYGYGVSRSPLVPGEGADVRLLWRAERDISADYVVALQLVDGSGKIWTSSDSRPIAGAYPTSRWVREEVVGDTHALLLPAAMPDGEYALEAALYDAVSGQRLTVLRVTTRSTDALRLGVVVVKGRERILQAPVPAVVQRAHFGDGIEFLGYALTRSGNAIELVLHYRAAAAMDRSYTVFVHLLDANSRIWAQRDSIPLVGRAPTTTWIPGEYVSDSYSLVIGDGAPPGSYLLEIGVYDAVSNERLAVVDESGKPAGDHVILRDAVTLP